MSTAGTYHDAARPQPSIYVVLGIRTSLNEQLASMMRCFQYVYPEANRMLRSNVGPVFLISRKNNPLSMRASKMNVQNSDE
ncbi:hypothetical protein WT01_31315 [Burkholderia cepacia]|nr:hypothetical protein WT01_31315 [Burkholderia cepacia]